MVVTFSGSLGRFLAHRATIPILFSFLVFILRFLCRVSCEINGFNGSNVAHVESCFCNHNFDTHVKYHSLGLWWRLVVFRLAYPCTQLEESIMSISGKYLLIVLMHSSLLSWDVVTSVNFALCDHFLRVINFNIIFPNKELRVLIFPKTQSEKSYTLQIIVPSFE